MSISNTLFMVFGTDEVQPWNEPELSKKAPSNKCRDYEALEQSED